MIATTAGQEQQQRVPNTAIACISGRNVLYLKWSYPIPCLTLSRPSLVLANGDRPPWASRRLPRRIGPHRALPGGVDVYSRLGGDGGLTHFQNEGYFQADIDMDAYCLSWRPTARYRPQVASLTLLQAKLDWQIIMPVRRILRYLTL